MVRKGHISKVVGGKEKVKGYTGCTGISVDEERRRNDVTCVFVLSRAFFEAGYGYSIKPIINNNKWLYIVYR